LVPRPTTVTSRLPIGRVSMCCVSLYQVLRGRQIRPHFTILMHTTLDCK
jgi:hypothetical protein